jgi:hypothetical protein
MKINCVNVFAVVITEQRAKNNRNKPVGMMSRNCGLSGTLRFIYLLTVE